MNLFGMLFFIAFFFSIFIFNVEEHSGRSIASKEFSMADKNWKRSYLNFEPDFPYTGLIHKPSHDGEYMQRLFGKLVQVAHKYSNEDWLDVERGYYLTYNNFLLLSLQVPMHESNLMHFTIRDPEHYCQFTNNILDPMKESDNVHKIETRVAQEKYSEIMTIFPDLKEVYSDPSKLYKNYCKTSKMNAKARPACKRLKNSIIRIDNVNRLLRNFPKFKNKVTTEFEIKNCEKLKEFESVRQMQFANDYADVGIFMFNSTSHPKVFTSNAVFDFNSVIDYGVEFLYSGYSTVANHNLLDHPEKYNYHESLSCFEGLDARTFSGRMFIMRGAWAGNYNSGKIKKSCRIDENHDAFKNAKEFKKPGYRINDRGYLQSMAKFFLDYRDNKDFEDVFDDVDTDNLEYSMFHKYLPNGSIEKKAFEEIIYNVFYGKNKSEYIKQVLEIDYDSFSELILRKEELVQKKVYTEEIETEDLEKALHLVEQIPPSLDRESIGKIPMARIDTEVLLTIPKIKKESIWEEGYDFSILNPKIEDSEEFDFMIDEEPILEVHTVPVEAVHIPKKDQDLFTHIIKGSDVNIRSKASYDIEDICGNSQYAKILPIRFTKVGTDGDFIKVELENTDSIVDFKKCADLEIFFIHKSFEKEILDFEVLSLGKILGPVTLRDKPGKVDGIIIGYELPSDTVTVIIDSLILEGSSSSSQYLWYQIIRADGERGWFYSGKAGEGQKIEVLDE
jgi:hypothetical protein